MTHTSTPHASEHGHSGEMISPQPCQELLWLRSVATEHPLTPAQIAVFVMLLSFREGERAKITKAELGALVGLKERQVANVLKELEAHIVGFIKAHRSGRSGNAYSFNQQLIAGNPVLVMSDNQQPDASKQMPVSNHNQQPTAVQPNSVCHQNSNQMPVENARPIRNAGARVELNSSLIRVLELNPDRVESSTNHLSRATSLHILNGRAVSMSGVELAQVLADRANNPNLDPAKSPGLHTSTGRIKALMAAGADFDTDIFPTVMRLVAASRKPIQTWGYFERAVREATADRLRAEQPMETITASEARTYGQYASASDQSPIVRRERISPATAARRQRQAEREARNQPVDLGRMDSLALK